MRSGLGVVIGVALAATLVMATPVGAKEPSGLDALPALSASEDPLEYVGDAGGLRLGVSIVSDTKAVAYLCDGERVGVWFTGSVDLETGEGSLKSKDGGSVTLDLNAGPPTATVVVDGETTTFTLAPVLGNGGVFRSVSKENGHRLTTGWIIADDGTIVGTTTNETGAPVAQSATTAPGTDPVSTGAIRCSVLAGRIDNARGRKDNTAANTLNNRAADLGCSGFTNTGIS